MADNTEKQSTFQSFLNDNQYSRKSILIYERIFGHTYVSTGGQDTTEEFCRYLSLQPDEKVLDVGCGIGGSAFYMIKTYGVKVDGIDLSANMISIARERQREVAIQNKITFEVCDVTRATIPENVYDIIYSRDTILHIENKEHLFSNFFKWLKPGGRLLITDYCRGDQEHSEEFKGYVAQRRYHLLTTEQYGKLLLAAGFEVVKSENRTSQFLEILLQELERFKKDVTFEKDFDQEDYDHIVDGWKAKIGRCQAGDMAWGLFMAKKPL